MITLCAVVWLFIICVNDKVATILRLYYTTQHSRGSSHSVVVVTIHKVWQPYCALLHCTKRQATLHLTTFSTGYLCLKVGNSKENCAMAISIPDRIFSPIKIHPVAFEKKRVTKLIIIK